MSYLVHEAFHGLPPYPLPSTRISHPSPLASSLPTNHTVLLAASQAQQAIHTSLPLHMLLHLSGMTLNEGGKNPILFFQPIPAHLQNKLDSASPGKASTNSFSGCSHVTRVQLLGAHLHETFIPAQVHRG